MPLQWQIYSDKKTGEPEPVDYLNLGFDTYELTWKNAEDDPYWLAHFRDKDAAVLATAAPDLLAALEEADKLIDGPLADLLTGDSLNDCGAYDILFLIRAAISKAKGELKCN